MKSDRKKPASVVTSSPRGLREPAEPTTGSIAAPAGFLVAFGLLVFWAMMYLDASAGGFNPTVHAPYRDHDELVGLQPVQEGGAEIKKGALVYANYCQACHQPAGNGAPGVAPPLAASEWVLAKGPNRLARIVLHGLQGPIMVKDTEWNLAMLPWKNDLDDAQIANVLTFIRKSWGNNASAIKPEEVAAIREQEKARDANWTAPELLNIPEANQ